jgi:hypothetical protein
MLTGCSQTDIPKIADIRLTGNLGSQDSHSQYYLYEIWRLNKKVFERPVMMGSIDVEASSREREFQDGLGESLAGSAKGRLCPVG